jgi:hypothetical protein
MCIHHLQGGYLIFRKDYPMQTQVITLRAVKYVTCLDSEDFLDDEIRLSV